MNLNATQNKQIKQELSNVGEKKLLSKILFLDHITASQASHAQECCAGWATLNNSKDQKSMNLKVHGCKSGT